MQVIKRKDNKWSEDALAIHEAIHKITERRDTRGMIECPKCKGTLHYVVSPQMTINAHCMDDKCTIRFVR